MIEYLTDTEWSMIIEQIKGRKCIPFLGAGANVRNDKKNYIGLPVGPRVAGELIKGMEPPIFKWNFIPGSDDDKLREVLNKKFRITWNKDAEIDKIDEKTRILSDGQDFILLHLNYNNTKVNITYLLCWEKITELHTEDLIRHLNRSYQMELSKRAKMKKYNDGKLFDFPDETHSISLQQYTEELRNNEKGIYEYIKNKTANEIYKLTYNYDSSMHELNVRIEKDKDLVVYLPLEVRDPKNLANVSLQYEITNNGRSVLINTLREKIIPDYKFNPSPLLIDLVKLPFKLIITTNYDRLLERAFEGIEYAFTWEGEKTDEKRLIEYLIKEYNLEWLKSAKINKTDDDIIVASDNNNNFIKLSIEKTKVNLKIDDGRIYELITKMENGHQNVYKYNGEHHKTIKVVVHPKKGYVETDETKTDIDHIHKIYDSKNSEGCIIYKFHGCFYYPEQNNEKNDSIVITEEDYITLLTTILNDFENKQIPKFIFSEIKTKSLLFLGYSLEDWDFRMLFDALLCNTSGIEQSRDFFWVAIQKNPPPFWVEYWKRKPQKIKIINKDIYEFMEDLKNACNS